MHRNHSTSLASAMAVAVALVLQGCIFGVEVDESAGTGGDAISDGSGQGCHYKSESKPRKGVCDKGVRGSGGCRLPEQFKFEEDEQRCDDMDNDCDGKTDEGCDEDNDGYCRESRPVAKDLPEVCPRGGGDCDDSKANVNPGGEEDVGDLVDENCDGVILCYEDADKDTYPDEAKEKIESEDAKCRKEDGEKETFLEDEADCNDDPDDGGAAIHPNATEFPGDETDQNCDGKEKCYADKDDDGFGTTDDTVVSDDDLDCEDKGEAPDHGEPWDCFDDSAEVRPDQMSFFEMPTGASSRKQPFDYDCDGTVEKKWSDTVQGTTCPTSTPCDTGSGWDTTTAPDCGESAAYRKCVKGGMMTCRANRNPSRTQVCR